VLRSVDVIMQVSVRCANWCADTAGTYWCWGIGTHWFCD